VRRKTGMMAEAGVGMMVSDIRVMSGSANTC
jgi:hypothetical protein